MADSITPVAPLPPLDTSTLDDLEPIPPEQLPQDSAATQSPASDAPYGDDQIGTFQQGGALDCWFLAPLGAVAQDPDGAAIIADTIDYDANSQSWTITFKGDPQQQPFVVTQEELDASYGGVSGDTDVRVLECAANKYIKAQAEKELINWAGDDPSRIDAVNEFMSLCAQFAQLKRAAVDLWREGQQSQTLNDEIQAVEQQIDDLIDAQDDPGFTFWANNYHSGINNPGVASNAFNLLTGSTLLPPNPKVKSDVDNFLSQLAIDPDGATAVVSSATDPRTGQPWYDNTQSASNQIGHVIYVTGFDAASQTITLTDQNAPDQPFTMSVADFQSWFDAQPAGTANLSYLEIDPSESEQTVTDFNQALAEIMASLGLSRA